jgi:MFS family permease
VCALLVALAYRPAVTHAPGGTLDPARLREVPAFFKRRGVVLVLVCGLALSMTQSSLLAYLALYGRESLALSSVEAARLLAFAQAGGAIARFGWGIISDRFHDSRRRPGIVTSAVLACVSFAALAFAPTFPTVVIALLAAAAGMAAFGWVGLYFTLVAEIGGARHAGLLTGVAVMFSWSGVLVGPPLFGGVLQATAQWTVPWVFLALIGLGVALVLPRPAQLVQRS